MHKPLHPFAALLLLAAAGPALAADDPPPQAPAAAAADPYDDVYSAILEGVDDQATLDRVLDTIMTALQREVPEMAIVEDARPGFLGELRTAMRPVMSDYSARVMAAYRPKVLKVLGEELTVDEARQVAAFYRSELGRKLLGGAVQHFDLDETMRSAVRNPDAPIESDTVNADFKRIGVQAYLALTPEERKQLDLIASQTPALMKLAAAQPRLTALRAEMENEPPTPEENARLEAVMTAAFAKLED
ncbi:MAG: DUF2059 domain-containing protein [Novosphingobium sp.]|nr:DUF2059 domain-containing protein [Novosphingobium sp.]MBO9603930.1 DUF2059 domain-containing protein [Novosphingobium sp.]